MRKVGMGFPTTPKLAPYILDHLFSNFGSQIYENMLKNMIFLYIAFKL